jgi:hypothetical protein
MNRDAASFQQYVVSFNPQPYVVTPRMARFMFVVATVAFLAAQSMVLLIFVKRYELHADHQIFLYVTTFCMPFPWLAGMQGYRHIKKQFVSTIGNQTFAQTVLYFVMFAIGVGYLQLLFCLGLVVSGLHLRI